MRIPEHVSSRAAVNDAAFALNEAGIGNAHMEASWLLQHVLEHPPLYDERLDAAQYQEFFAFVGQRAHRVPLQHMMGEMYFRGLKLRARPGIFVVRPETEWVAEAGIETAQVRGTQGIPPQVLDLGYGSGVLGLAVAAEAADTVLTSVDISLEAVALTQENVDLCGIKVRVILADATDLGGLISALAVDSRSAPHETDRKTAATEGEYQTEAASHESENNGANETKATPKLHVIVTSPPYVIETVTQPETAAGPPQAFYGGGIDGLDIPRRFLENVAKLLAAGGTVVMKHGETQGEALVVTAHDLGFGRAHIEKDLAGRPRFLRASEHQGL